MAVSTVALLLISVAGNFWLVLALLAAWAIVFAAIGPVRQSYVNGIIPSEQRATGLSTDNLLNSAGGMVSQPALGKIAEIWGYPASYLGSAIFQGDRTSVPTPGPTRERRIRPDPCREI